MGSFIVVPHYNLCLESLEVLLPGEEVVSGLQLVVPQLIPLGSLEVSHPGRGIHLVVDSEGPWDEALLSFLVC